MERRIIEYNEEFDVDVKKFIEYIYAGEFNLDYGIEKIRNEDVYLEYLNYMLKKELKELKKTKLSMVIS